MAPSRDRAPVLVVLGPTATGKTAVAVELAHRVNGEVISADSRAFFRGLDIVTDKPNLEARDGVVHHLIDCVPIDGTYDAMAFRADVVRLLPEIRSRGRVPIVAGGGTLYLGAILRGIFDGPAKDPAIRAELEAQPLTALVEELSRVDPDAAARIHPNDRLRIVRALEVFRGTGRAISDWHTDATPLPERFWVAGLTRARNDHRHAIEERVQRMVKRGVFAEISALVKEGLTPDVQAYRTVGVPEAFEVLDGRLSEAEFVDTVAHRTWQLARRQAAWFRRDRNVHWVDMTHAAVRQAVTDLLEHWDLVPSSGREDRP